MACGWSVCVCVVVIPGITTSDAAPNHSSELGFSRSRVMLLEDWAKTHERWGCPVWGRGDPAAHGGHSLPPRHRLACPRCHRAVGSMGATRACWMCQRCSGQLSAFPPTPGDSCGVACWNLLLLGWIWAEESWYGAGWAVLPGLGGRTCSGGRVAARSKLNQSARVTVGNQVPVQVGNKWLAPWQD